MKFRPPLPILIALLWFAATCTASNDAASPPICQHCNCSNTSAICRNPATYEHLFSESMWSHGGAISTLTIDYEVPELNRTFPAALRHLRTLDMRNCRVARITDGAFANLQQMNELLLGGNQLYHRLQPDAFKGLRMDGEDYPMRSLKILRINGNRLHTLDDDLFEHVEDELEVLDLSGNPLKVIDLLTLQAIASLQQLKELDLSETGISALPEHFLHTPKHLRVLHLSQNPFKVVPNGLEEAHALQVLHLDATEITYLGKNMTFPRMPTLKQLHLCRNGQLERIDGGAFSNLINLEVIHVCDNMRLREIDARAFTRTEFENEIWPPLKKVYLGNNQIAYVDMHLVLHWDKLIDLNLNDNPWACECENQWMVEELMATYARITNDSHVAAMRCETPIEMKNQHFVDLYKKKRHLRCLDFYGNRPEKDAALLVGLLITLLLGMAIVLSVLLLYKRGLIRRSFKNSPAGFSRQFYTRAHSDEL